MPPSAIGPALFANDPCTSLSAIVTRPSVSTSVCTVRPKHVLVETGYQNTSASGGGNTFAYPQMLVRIGTSVRSLEADFSPPSYGPTDGAIGLKYVAGATPKFAWGAATFATLAVGAPGLTASGTEYNGALNWSYAVSPAFSLSGTFAGQSTTNGSQRWGQFIPSFVAGVSLPHNVGVFGEIAGFTNALGPGTPTLTQYLAGTTYDIGPRLQIDLEGGLSPSTKTSKYTLFGFGVSYYH